MQGYSNVLFYNTHDNSILVIFFHLRTFVSLLLERDKGGGEGEQEKEKGNIDVREQHQLVASRTCPNPGSNVQPRYAP